MASAKQYTVCPLCKLPMLPGQTITDLPNEYPCHYACRVSMLHLQEESEDADATREYNFLGGNFSLILILESEDADATREYNALEQDRKDNAGEEPTDDE